MAKANPITIDAFKPYDAIPTASRSSWAVKLLNDFLAQDEKIMGAEFDEKSIKSKHAALSKALHDHPELKKKVKLYKRGNTLLLEKI